MIKIQEGHVKFDGQYPVEALKNVSLTVKKGDWLTILCPSGSGKTTLLNVISGDERLTEGKIEVDGKIYPTFQLPKGKLTAETPSAIFFRTSNYSHNIRYYKMS